MQRATTAPASTPSVSAADPVTTCPVCGEPVRGIATARPGEHRFVGCDHYASARFLRSEPAVLGADDQAIRLGP